MNVFYLDRDPAKCAKMHCDKHVVKMIIEYAQLMSTAQRMIDGSQYVDASSGRKIKRWQLPDERESVVYKASHINHPSAVWTRQSREHYEWLYELFMHLSYEYTYRYGRMHATPQKLSSVLLRPPSGLQAIGFIDPPPAMPDEYKVADSIQSYHNYYRGSKRYMARWTNREIPDWFV